MKRSLDTDRPIFLQIKENIEDDIMSGRIAPGEQIPSTHQLVAFYNINPITALKGVNLLTDEGIVFKKRGIGMFVSPDALEILRRKYRRIFYDEYVIRMAIRASQLGIDLAELKEMLNNAWEINNAWEKGENSGEN